MGILSNLLRPAAGDRDDRDPAGVARHPLVCRPAGQPEIHEAVRMVLSAPGRPAGDAQVVDFLRMAVHRRIDLRDLWVADHGGRVVTTVLAVPSPGHTALLLLPAGVRGIAVEAVGPLANAVCAHLRSRGVHLVQALVDPGHATLDALTRTGGFDVIAELVYLHATVRRAPPRPGGIAGLTWRSYAPATHADFARAIEASYVDSLDCPALNGVRGIEDVIAGHKATGEFDPRLWHVGYLDGQLAGVLLLSPVTQAGPLELVYLGVAPAARGRGLGSELMQRALATTRELGLNRLTLAVDARNAPALKLYYRHGMSRVTSKAALLRDLRRGGLGVASCEF